MTHTIFTVTPQQLAALDAARAVELVADLLWAEARRLGFPTTQVQVSTRINVPDGGVDASIDSSGTSGLNDSSFSEGRAAFQIKTGEPFKPWQEAEIRRELFGTKTPPLVAAFLSSGHQGTTVKLEIRRSGGHSWGPLMGLGRNPTSPTTCRRGRAPGP